MRVDVTDLEAFAHLGEQSAAGTTKALEALTNHIPSIVVQGVSITTIGTLRDRLAAGHRCVRISLQGGIVGDALIDLPPDDAAALLAALPPRSADDDTALLEVGNGVVRHILDAIHDENHVDITVSPPRYTTLEALTGDEMPYLVECRLGVPTLDVSFDLFLRLTGGTFDRLLAGTFSTSAQTVTVDPSPVSVTQLGEFAQTIARGVDRGGVHASKMTGIELEARPHRLQFLTRPEIRGSISETDQIGAGFALSEPPGGFVLVGVDRSSGQTLGMRSSPTESTEQMRDPPSPTAILDVITHLASGVLEGWSPLFGDEIDHAPAQELSTEEPCLSPFMDWLDTDRRYGYAVEVTLATPDQIADCDIYAMPDDFPLLEALDHATNSTTLVEPSRN